MFQKELRQEENMQLLSEETEFDKEFMSSMNQYIQSIHGDLSRL